MINWSVSQLERQLAEEADAGGVSPVRVDVPRVRADQPATPPVRSSGDTSRDVDVRASSISNAEKTEEGNATSIAV